VTLSPDGKELAFLRTPNPGYSELVVANENGSGEKILARRNSPFALVGGIAWSPNDRTIATNVFSEVDGRAHPVEFPVQGGEERPLTDKLEWLGDLAWLSDGRGLILNSTHTGTLTQIVYLSYANGEMRRITTDTNRYNYISLTADSRTLATVQEKASFDTWVAPLVGAANAKPITSGGSSWETAWSPDGKIVFTRFGGQGEPNICIMESDGSNTKQLTASAGMLNLLPRVSPDGHYIVFVSGHFGTLHLLENGY
jgi:Tol biopolymer transport system component